MFIVYHFLPGRAKNDTQRMKHHRQAKVLTLLS
jgi:hypothetical protein